jgi:hypothetical protein
MNRLFDRVWSLCGCSLLVAAACSVGSLRGQDEPPPPPPTPHRAEVLILRQGAPCDQETCTKQTFFFNRLQVKPQGTAEAAGVTHVLPLPASEFFFSCHGEPAPHAGVKFVRLGCACTAATGECHCAGSKACGEDCAAAATDDCRCCPCSATAGAGCGEDGCEVKHVEVRQVRRLDDPAEHHPIKLMQHIAGLVGERAAAQAALEVRLEADEQIGEIYEAMAELLADNAALDAKLQAQAEQRKLLEKIADLAAENARLKVHAELATERVEIARSSAALTLENERLKLRLAEVEHKHAVSEATRTAAKPRERKASR